MTTRKEQNGTVLKWLPQEASPRLKGWFHLLTVQNESRVLAQAEQLLQKAGMIVT